MYYVKSIFDQNSIIIGRVRLYGINSLQDNNINNINKSKSATLISWPECKKEINLSQNKKENKLHGCYRSWADICHWAEWNVVDITNPD